MTERQQNQTNQVQGAYMFKRQEKEGRSYSQMKEFIEHRVQRFQFHLCTLTLGQWKEMVRTKLHYNEGVAQTCKRPVKGTYQLFNFKKNLKEKQIHTILPLASSAIISAACRISTVSLCSGAS